MEDLCCAIEKEPRTLNEGELNNAREAAAVIVQKEAAEALNIFTKGMKPVVSIKEMEKEVEKRNQLHRLVEIKESAEIIERSCDCQCSSTNLEDSPDKINTPEPLTAPF
ncbi:uncharacterized protein LOC131222968 [Magnolia sinica]|uniref:uncharacterized protein LOC131222968 n=1 Tax=Magnolia sinica TaxID=86752 RepID=UPI00265886FF|nr:uncharacterized protein LOC131222968 [Magnolia sinica]